MVDQVTKYCPQSLSNYPFVVLLHSCGMTRLVSCGVVGTLHQSKQENKRTKNLLTLIIVSVGRDWVVYPIIRVGDFLGIFTDVEDGGGGSLPWW